MKFVAKTMPPEQYLEWCNTQRALGQNYNYGSLPGDVRRILLSFLVREQGWICGYTMKRINENLAHIEHVIPQNECRRRGAGRDLDYLNLLACFPPSGASCAYGAVAKGGWWGDNDSDFVSSLTDDCEVKFYFQLNGEVLPVRNLPSIENTIERLQLNNAALVDERKRAIEEYLYGEERDNPIEYNDIDTRINEIMTSNEEGEMHEFCLAIHDSLFSYLDIINSLEPV